ncbi:MAG: hypothetical protein JNG85_18005, partial [Spirochaetaceae bacterium]|nr:hypothetical protein [Spirochaetaceae bacterium]
MIRTRNTAAARAVAPVLALVLAAALAGAASAETFKGDKARYAGIGELRVDAGPVDIEARSGGTELSVERFDFPEGYVLLVERRGANLELVVKTPPLGVAFTLGLRASA